MSSACVQEEDQVPPAVLSDQMFYSTMSSLHRKPSLSSDEEGDIYCPTLGPAGSGGEVHPSHQMETTDQQVDQDTKDRDTLKPDQVRPDETR